MTSIGLCSTSDVITWHHLYSLKFYKGKRSKNLKDSIWACPSKNVIRCSSSGKKGLLLCCKCLFESIGANLAYKMSKTCGFTKNLPVSMGLRLYGDQMCRSNFWPDMLLTWTCQKMWIISYVFERYSSRYKRYKTTQTPHCQIPHNCTKGHTKQMNLLN